MKWYIALPETKLFKVNCCFGELILLPTQGLRLSEKQHCPRASHTLLSLQSPIQIFLAELRPAKQTTTLFALVQSLSLSLLPVASLTHTHNTFPFLCWLHLTIQLFHSFSYPYLRQGFAVICLLNYHHKPWVSATNSL